MIFVDMVVIVSVAWAVITQLMIPVLQGSRLFPAFSKKASGYADELSALHQEIEAEHLRHEIERQRQLLEKEQHERS
jgi:hypothetical protein